MPASTQGTGSSQRMSPSVDDVALDQGPDADQAEEGQAHHEVADVDGVASGQVLACSKPGVWLMVVSFITGAPRSAPTLRSASRMTVGDVGAAVVLAVHADVDAAGLLAEQDDVAGAVDPGPSTTASTPGGHDHLDPADVGREPDRAPVEAARGRRRCVRSRIELARSRCRSRSAT